MAQLMPLPLTVSCFSKIEIGFTFVVLDHPGSPRQRAIKCVCVCVCACMHVCVMLVDLNDVLVLPFMRYSKNITGFYVTTHPLETLCFCVCCPFICAYIHMCMCVCMHACILGMETFNL